MTKTQVGPDIPRLQSLDPSSGKVLGEVQANTPDEVREAVEHARKAAPEWGALSVKQRGASLKEVRHRIFENLDRIVETISSENGKPRAEALSHDVLPALITIQYLEGLAAKALKTEHVGRFIGPVMGTSSRIEFRPFGVVGAITPWNYPFFLAFMAITPALVAGNAVVLKPSEATPGVGERLKEILDPLPPGVCTVVQGAGEVGAALVDAPVDKICFIGSPGTGRRIAEAAAKHLTPVVMELGGQDAAIVCEDAHLDTAASGVLWGAFLNCGQTCAAIERVYVPETIADAFEAKLVEKLKQVPAEDFGPLTVPRQLDIVKRHVADAVQHGAKVLAGGPADTNGEGLHHPPTIVEGRSEEMAIFKEETFGPLLPVIRVRDEDEAVERANREGFNLTSSVWTSNKRRGDRIAARLRAGTVSINDHAIAAAAPWAVWGGVGESGYGRLNGELGIREFTVPVHVTRNTLPKMKRLFWYPYDRPTTEAFRGLAGVYSAPTWRGKLKALGTVARTAGKAIRHKL
ncbi:MAG: aldehyde dehydrogenase family protein [Actinomycetota bacterium]